MEASAELRAGAILVKPGSAEESPTNFFYIIFFLCDGGAECLPAGRHGESAGQELVKQNSLFSRTASSPLKLLRGELSVSGPGVDLVGAMMRTTQSAQYKEWAHDWKCEAPG